jgi:hypothetical protein
MRSTSPRFASRVLLTLLYAVVILIYIGYFVFILQYSHAAVDYETFMAIGSRFRAGAPVWTENSYYPMPYVLVFALFSALPHTLSIVLWHGAPVIAALYIARWNLWPLLFAPLLAHVLGGQTAFFGLVGLYLYRQHMDNWRGGIGLALLLMKPQLAVFPVLWAGAQWVIHVRQQRLLPRQPLAFLLLALLIYVPGFFLIPDWMSQWLAQPRGLFERALAGLVPRSLYVLLGGISTGAFWLLLVGIAAVLFVGVWLALRRRLTFDSFMLWSFIVNPLLHDYDLIQMIPLLDNRRLRLTAILASLPLWWVIPFAYTNDSSWFLVTLIAPAVLLVYLRQARVAPPEQRTPDSGKSQFLTYSPEA